MEDWDNFPRKGTWTPYPDETSRHLHTNTILLLPFVITSVNLTSAPALHLSLNSCQLIDPKSFFTFNFLRTVPFVKIYGQLKNIYVSYSSPRLVIPPFQISTASCPSATFPRGGRPTTRPSPCPPPRPTQRRNPAAIPPSCAAFALRRHFCQRGA